MKNMSGTRSFNISQNQGLTSKIQRRTNELGSTSSKTRSLIQQNQVSKFKSNQMGFRPVYQQAEFTTLKSPNSIADSDMKHQR